MSKIALESNESGTGVFTIASPNSNTDRTLNLPDKAGTVNVGEGIDDNATSTAVTIDSSGNVGIGITPTTILHVDKPAASCSPIFSSGTGGVYLAMRGANDTHQIQYGDGAGSPTFAFYDYTASSERMRIDSSGNLLVGTDGANPHNASEDAGVALRSDGRIHIGVDGDTPLHVNRNTSDGDIIRVRKDGTTVGSIGVESGLFGIGSGDTGLKYWAAGNAIAPCNPSSTFANRDNAIDMGTSANRFDDIYATNGTIQTSDVNEKQDIEALSEAETRVAVAAKALLRKFRWRSAVEEKGDEARIHFGIIAQDLQAAFEAEGLDASNYAMFIHSTWTDEETGEERSRMGVRYSELLAFIIAAI